MSTSMEVMEITAKDFRKYSNEQLMSGSLKNVKVGRYKVTKHAQYKIGDRNIARDEVISNLCRKPVFRTKTELGTDGRPKYRRYSDSLMTIVNPRDKTLVSARGYHEPEAKSMGIKNHRPYMTQTEADRIKAKSKSVRGTSTTKVRRASTTKPSVNKSARRSSVKKR